MSYVNTVPMSFSAYNVNGSETFALSSTSDVQSGIGSAGGAGIESGIGALSGGAIKGDSSMTFSETLSGGLETLSGTLPEAPQISQLSPTTFNTAPSAILSGGEKVLMGGADKNSPMKNLFEMYTSGAAFKKCVKAPLQPPDWFFGFAWTFLYTVYGVTLYDTWQTVECRNSLLWGLGLNLLWTPIFAYNSKYALLVLAAMIVLAFDSLKKLNKNGYIIESNWFTVYIVWLFFALYLNMYIASRCKN